MNKTTMASMLSQIKQSTLHQDKPNDLAIGEREVQHQCNTTNSSALDLFRIRLHMDFFEECSDLFIKSLSKTNTFYRSITNLLFL